MVFQNLCGNKRTNIETIHARHLDNALTFDKVSANHVVGFGIAAADVHVVAVANTCAEHFFLPVNIGTTVLQGNPRVVLCILAQVARSCHVVCLQNFVEGYITIVRNIDFVLSTFLGGDHDHTIGCFRTVNGRSGSITQHVDALNIIG